MKRAPSEDGARFMLVPGAGLDEPRGERSVAGVLKELSPGERHHVREFTLSCARDRDRCGAGGASGADGGEPDGQAAAEEAGLHASGDGAASHHSGVCGCLSRGVG